MLNDILAMYKGVNIEAPIAKGLKGRFAFLSPDCDCIDCDESADCSNCDAPGTTH